MRRAILASFPIRRREESDVIATREYRQFIGGDWVDAVDGATFENLDPFTGDVVSTVAAGGGEDTRRAVDAGEGAFGGGGGGGAPAGGPRGLLQAAGVP